MNSTYTRISTIIVMIALAICIMFPIKNPSSRFADVGAFILIARTILIMIFPRFYGLNPK